MSWFSSVSQVTPKLFALVSRAAGEEAVIARNGVPCARLVPIQQRAALREPADGMGISYIAANFDDFDPRVEAMFGGDAA